MPPPTLEAIAAAQARIEERQAAYEVVVRRVLTCLEVHNEKLDAVLAAVEPLPGPSPIAASMSELTAALQAHTSAMLEARDGEAPVEWEAGWEPETEK